MSPDDALRQAATALLATVSPITVKAVLRTLLAESAEEPAAKLPKTATAVKQPNGANGHAAVKGKQPRWEGGELAAWRDLRHAVRAAMRERGVRLAELARLTGYTEATLETALSQTKPSAPMWAKLDAWLAPEVAADGPAFRTNGTRAAHAGGTAAT
jgi:hypothetical protein